MAQDTMQRCKHGTERAGLIKVRDFVDQLSDY